MSPRPPVSVVMPFSGTTSEGERALQILQSLDLGPQDERLLVDNASVLGERPEVLVAPGERSPSHARNAGAARARGEWILFLDADTIAPPDILARFFAAGEPAAEVGALVGEIEAAGPSATLASRYAASRNFLGAAAHLAHPYLPRAAAANLMVRAAAFRAVGGFAEGVRAAEDTDFAWRLQRAGWTLELRADAVVGHVYRQSLRALRRQWRAYAAGRAWLAELYPDFRPEPALARVGRRLLRRSAPRPRPAPPDRHAGPHAGFSSHRGKTRSEDRDRTPDDPRFLLVDAILAVDELIGLHQSNEL